MTLMTGFGIWCCRNSIYVYRFCQMPAVHRKRCSACQSCELYSLKLSSGHIPGKLHRSVLISHLGFICDKVEIHIVNTCSRQFKIHIEWFTKRSRLSFSITGKSFPLESIYPEAVYHLLHGCRVLILRLGHAFGSHAYLYHHALHLSRRSILFQQTADRQHCSQKAEGCVLHYVIDFTHRHDVFRIQVLYFQDTM